MNAYFTVGQMAKLHNMNPKTLRYYDEIDLFKPIEVNEDNGYRYYSAEQFKQLDFINYLKTVGLTLEEIKEQLHERNLEGFIETMEMYSDINRAKIDELHYVQKTIDLRMHELKRLQQFNQLNEPLLEYIPKRHTLNFKSEITSIYDLEIALRTLKEKTDHFISVFVGKIGLVISEEQVEDSTLTYDSIFYVLEVEDRLPVLYLDAVSELVEGTYATIYFRGGHAEARTYYERLKHYIAKEQAQPIGPYTIRVLIDQFISDDPKEHLSVISVPIAELPVE